MATTEEYKNGGSASYSFSIEYIKAEDIKVSVDGTDLTYTATNPPAQTTEYTVNGSNVIFKQASVSGSTNGGVRIYRETELENSDSVTFHAGSSIRAADLNANHKLVRFSAQEKNQEIVTADIRDSAVTSAKILDGTIVEGDLANSAVTQNKLANNSVGTPELINGSVNSDKILDGTIVNADVNASAAIAGTKINPIFGSQTIITTGNAAVGGTLAVTGNITVGGTVDGRDVAADGTKLDTCETNSKDDQTAAEIKTLLQSDKLTASEIAEGALDGRYFTETESDARYFNISSGETIKDGDTFPDNDTTIATTAAINDRIIDLVDSVGGFVPIANENNFPSNNPDINPSGASKDGTIVSVKEASTNLVPSNNTITIANGTANNANTVTITGVPSTIPQGFGFLVETTVTDHTYTFHRLTPKATEVTTVAGSIGSINTVGNAISNVNTVAGSNTEIHTVAAISANVTTVAGISSNVTSVANNESNINEVANNDTNINTVATNNTNINTVAGISSNINSVVSNASNINSAVSNASNINTVAGSISNVNNVGGSISNVNSVASNLSSVNSFANTYRIGSNNPTTSLDVGDLFFNTTSNSLKVYTGSAWVDGVTATGNFAVTTGNTFSGSNRYNDNVKAEFGTGADLEIYHDGSNSYIQHGTVGNLRYQSGNHDFYNQAGNEFMCRMLQDGGVSLYYDHSKKLETTSSGAVVTGTLGIGANTSGKPLHVGTYGSGNGEIALASSTTGYGSILFGDSASGTNLYKGYLQYNHNTDRMLIATNAGARITILSDGKTGINNGSPTESLDVTGNIAVSGTVDGVDIAAFKTSFDNLSTDIVSDTSPQLGGALDANGHNINIDDNNSVQFGNSGDLQILHDGNSRIKHTGGGVLSIQGDDVRIHNPNANEFMAKFVENGVSELYYDNSKKLSTSPGGVNVTGELNVTTKVAYPDNAKAIFGTGDDLQIYHNGTNNIIHASNGYLQSRASAHYINNEDSSINFIRCENTMVSLHYNGSKKFETTSTGNQVTGQLVIPDGSNTSGANNITFGSDNDCHMYHNGSHLYLVNTTGNLDLRAKAGEKSIVAVQDGAIELYHNNNKKLETISSGVQITGDLLSNSNVKVNDNGKLIAGSGNDLQIHHDGTDDVIHSSGTSLRTRSNIFRAVNEANSANMFRSFHNGAFEAYYDGSKKFETTSDGNFCYGHLFVPSDTSKIKVGGSYDLEIYHNGSHSYISDVGTGSLIQTTNGTGIYLQKGTSESLANFKTDGAVELMYDDTKKFETTSSGTHSSGTDFTFGASGTIPTIKAGGNNTDFRFAAVGAGGHILLNTSGTDRWYIFGTSGHFVPTANNTYDIGSTTYRVRNIYTNDLHLSNEGSSNDVDGTWGDWTMQEGESDLFLKNNRSGKKYKFNLTEVS